MEQGEMSPLAYTTAEIARDLIITDDMSPQEKETKRGGYYFHADNRESEDSANRIRRALKVYLVDGQSHGDFKQHILNPHNFNSLLLGAMVGNPILGELGISDVELRAYFYSTAEGIISGLKLTLAEASLGIKIRNKTLPIPVVNSHRVQKEIVSLEFFQSKLIQRAEPSPQSFKK